MSFEGKTAVITGGASGMGLLTGQNLAKDGAHVVLCDLNREMLDEKVNEIVAEGGSCIGIVCDVTKYDQVVMARDKAVEVFGSIDILVCCAGGDSHRILGCPEDFIHTPIEVYDFGIDLNLKGALYFCHACMQQMAVQMSGAIIVMGSVTGLEGGDSGIDYATAKSGIMNGMVKSLAISGGRYNVRANCVAPGPVLTRPAMANMKTLMGRAAETQEVVDLILYLLSDKAAFITGSTFLIDGGRTVMRDKG